MRQHIRLGVASLLLLLGSLARADICRVDDDNAGAPHDGISWPSAYQYLQDGLSDAKCSEIWVAGGIYYPDVSSVAGDSNNVSEFFALRSDVAIYGGFDGSETARDERDWEANVTVLSGDITQNDSTDSDGVVNDTTDINSPNALHVAYVEGVSETAILDGVLITAGQASTTNFPDDRGGGLFNAYESHPTIRNVKFVGNTATSYGGALYNFSFSSPTLTNVGFFRNEADSGGGLYTVYEGYPTLTDAVFSRNQATEGGGANIYGSHPIFVNVAFEKNTATNGGGAVVNHGESRPIFINVAFIGNSAEGSGAGIKNDGSDLEITNAAFVGNQAGLLGGALWNYQSNPWLTNVTLAGNSADIGGSIFNRASSSPNLANVISWGNRAATDSPEIHNDDAESNPYIGNSDIQGSGGSGATWDVTLGDDGGGNLDENPRFVRDPAPGLDGTWGTVDDDYGDLRLQETSPAIDVGDTLALPADVLDLDSDNDSSELIPYDLDNNPRVVNGIVDLGAYELDLAVDDYLPVVTNVFVEKIKGPGKRYYITADADDRLTGSSNIVAAHYSIDGLGAFSMAAADGLFDTPMESVEATSIGVNLGKSKVCVVALDAAGNESVPACAKSSKSNKGGKKDKVPPGQAN